MSLEDWRSFAKTGRSFPRLASSDDLTAQYTEEPKPPGVTDCGRGTLHQDIGSAKCHPPLSPGMSIICDLVDPAESQEVMPWILLPTLNADVRAGLAFLSMPQVDTSRIMRFCPHHLPRPRKMNAFWFKSSPASSISRAQFTIRLMRDTKIGKRNYRPSS